MRTVVVGATGNAGTALLRALARDRPNDSVVGVARRPPETESPFPTKEWVSLDVTAADAADRLRAVMRDADAVVHLAIAFQPMRDRDYLRAVNVDAVRTVATACADAGVPHLVHMSSGGVYAPGSYGEKVDESWPRTGVSSSTYSMDKAAAEDVLDEFEAAHPDVAVARIRPGLIGQYEFGSALLRYALPDLVPSAIVDHLPILPIDRSFAVPAAHSDDVADAIVRVLDRRATGPYNLGGPTPVRAHDVADAFGARIVPVPGTVPAGEAPRYTPCTAGEHLEEMYRKTYGLQTQAAGGDLLEQRRHRRFAEHQPVQRDVGVDDHGVGLGRVQGHWLARLIELRIYSQVLRQILLRSLSPAAPRAALRSSHTRALWLLPTEKIA